MGMEGSLIAQPECRPAADWARRKSDIGTAQFRCNITNHYFYFRLIAFVNRDILFQLAETRLLTLTESKSVW